MLLKTLTLIFAPFVLVRALLRGDGHYSRALAPSSQGNT
jgi:hypothetical protein